MKIENSLDTHNSHDSHNSSKEWFEKRNGLQEIGFPEDAPHHVCWWVRARHRPGWDEALKRLRQLADRGESSKDAFTFFNPFPAPSLLGTEVEEKDRCGGRRKGQMVLGARELGAGRSSESKVQRAKALGVDDALLLSTSCCYALPVLVYARLCYLGSVPFTTAVALATAHVGVAAAAFLYHLYQEREYAMVDQTLARAAMLANAYACRYDTWCGLGAVAVGSASLLVFYSQESTSGCSCGHGRDGAGGDVPPPRGSGRRRACKSQHDACRRAPTSSPRTCKVDEHERETQILLERAHSRSNHNNDNDNDKYDETATADAWYHSLWHLLGCAVGILVAMSRS